MGVGLLDSIERYTQLAGHNRLALLLFRANARQIFGINVLKVQEVLSRPQLTHLPSAHPLVAGVAEVRGAMVPVIDMARALGLPADGEARYVVIAEFTRSTQGFLVRSVERIVHVDVSKLTPPPEDHVLAGLLTAVTTLGDEQVEIVDVERILAEITGAQTLVSAQTLAALKASGIDASRRPVLIADDSRVARTQITRVLEQIGVPVIAVADGRQALTQLQEMAALGPLQDQLLMLISDIEMPDMDGYRLATEIRQDVRLQGLYVMLHTSLSGVFNQAMVRKVGADRFIAKLDADELAQAVIERLLA